MRWSSSLLHVFVGILSATCFSLASSKHPLEGNPNGGRAVRYLKDPQETNALSPEGEERGWQSVVKNLENTNVLKNADELQSKNAARWQRVAEKLAPGQKLRAQTKDVDEVKWTKSLAKLEDEGKINEAGKEKLTKITKEAAQEVAKNPKKWPRIKKALEISFGAVLTGVILVGIEGMLASGQ